MPGRSPVYRFADFVLDVGERSLAQGARRIYLPPKIFATLVYFIEHPNRILTKEELIDELWPDAHVTENALTRSVKEVREALQDDVQHPRFIQTIPRVGYKFIADLEPAGDPAFQEAVGERRVAERAEKAASQSPASLCSHRKRLSRSVTGGFCLIVLALGAAIWYLGQSQEPALGFAERDWLLIADFENFTSEPVFDVALRTALEREVSRSSYVNYAPPGRVFDTLRLMKLEPNTSINPSVGCEICIRDGNIRALLAGSIQEIGDVYAIDVKVLDPRTGITTKSLAEEAKGLEEVLPAIRRLAITVRKTLGESLASISSSDRQLERVTTPSLIALEAFTKGWRLYEQLAFSDSLAFFDQALSEDPNFAMAHWARGWANHWTRKPFLPDFNRAAELVGGVTDREKYTILGTQALYCFGDLPGAMEIQKHLLELYPDDYLANETLGRISAVLNDFSQWEECVKNRQRIRPNYPSFHFEMALWALFFEGDVERFHAESKRLLSLDPNHPGGLPRVADPIRDWMRGNLKEAEARFSEFRDGPMADLRPPFNVSVRPFLARFYLFIGKPDIALELLETNRGMAHQFAGTDVAAYTLLERALLQREQGNLRQFERLAKEAASRSVGLDRVEALGWLGIVSARQGRFNEARHWRDELQKEERLPPIDVMNLPTPWELDRAKHAFSLQIDGETALAGERLEEATSCFGQVIDLVPPDRGGIGNHLLQPQLYLVASESMAKIFEKQDNWERAVEAYRQILEHKVLTIKIPGASGIWVQALISISRALEKAGRSSEASVLLEQYRQLRPGSDPEREASDCYGAITVLPSR
jgi:DNA-binding winged helix-turn-helix (wHTH) protein/tetratricopeptide (TPR) repeat protein